MFLGVILIPMSQETFILYICYHSKVSEQGRGLGALQHKLQSLQRKVQLRSGLGFTTSLTLAEGGTCSFTLDYTTVITQIARKLNN